MKPIGGNFLVILFAEISALLYLPEYIGAPYTVYRVSKPHSVRVTNSAISGLGLGSTGWPQSLIWRV